MSRLLAVFLIFLVPTMAGAVPLWPPMDTPTFVAKTTDILIARCLNPDVLGGGKTDGLTLVEVEVLVVVKGDRKTGKTRLGTIGQPMEAGNRYLMASFGGKWGDTDFVAQSDQAVVEMPADFDLKSLAGKTAVQQVQAIFDARRAQLERLLQRLQRRRRRWIIPCRSPARTRAPIRHRCAPMTSRETRRRPTRPTGGPTRPEPRR